MAAARQITVAPVALPMVNDKHTMLILSMDYFKRAWSHYFNQRESTDEQKIILGFMEDIDNGLVRCRTFYLIIADDLIDFYEFENGFLYSISCDMMLAPVSLQKVANFVYKVIGAYVTVPKEFVESPEGFKFVFTDENIELYSSTGEPNHIESNGKKITCSRMLLGDEMPADGCIAHVTKEKLEDALPREALDKIALKE